MICRDMQNHWACAVVLGLNYQAQFALVSQLLHVGWPIIHCFISEGSQWEYFAPNEFIQVCMGVCMSWVVAEHLCEAV